MKILHFQRLGNTLTQFYILIPPDDLAENTAWEPFLI